MLKLKFQYFGHLVRRDNSLGKTLILGKIEGRRRKEQQRMRWLDGIPDHCLNGHVFEQTLGDSEGRKIWHAAVRGATKGWTQLSD